MRALSVVVADVLSKDPFEMTMAKSIQSRHSVLTVRTQRSA